MDYILVGNFEVYQTTTEVRDIMSVLIAFWNEIIRGVRECLEEVCPKMKYFPWRQYSSQGNL